VLAFLSQGYACNDDATTRDIKSKLDSAANYLNAAAKTNRELNQQNVINDEQRRQVAGKINKVNGFLKIAVERARDLRPGMIGATKTDVIALLNSALNELEGFRIGNAKIDDTLALAIPLIRQAITLVAAIKEAT
jgi:hypothetical protein